MNRSVIGAISPSTHVLFFAPSHGTVYGTIGTPLGSISSTWTRYSNKKGPFFVAEAAPCSMGDLQPLTNSGFILNANNGAIPFSQHLRIAAMKGHIDDDTPFPTYTTNPMGTNDVSLRQRAFSPFCCNTIDPMCHPYTLFDVALTNNNIEKRES